MNPLSDTAGKVDSAFVFIAGISVALLALVTFFMIFFVIRYRAKKHPVPEEIEGNLLLEIVWTVVPTILVIAMFFVGYKGFLFMRKPPADAMAVKAVARMWSWIFIYENGKKSDVLKVPVNKSVRMIITSEDVLHSLFIPAFRVKEDAVPGMETTLWFTPNATGSYDLFCSEYCGTGHSTMITKVEVMPDRDFAAWYSLGGSAAEAAKGQTLLADKGCLGCHSIDGSKKVGPTLKGILGRKETVVTAGKERDIVVDEEYLRKSVMEPSADIVKGYPPVMLVIPVTKEELDAVVGALKEMK
jgi:cytochrome c oxidase subunit 2